MKSQVKNFPGITDIIGSFLTGRPTTRERAKAVRQTIGEVTTRRFLLKKADRYDLEAVKEKAGYTDLNAEFRNAIEEALKTAALGGTRTKAYDIQSAKKTKKEFMEIEHAVGNS